MISDAEIRETLLAYAKSGMKKTVAAERLFITTNGLEYRFHQIKSKTGENPKEFFSLVRLLKRYGKKNV